MAQTRRLTQIIFLLFFGFLFLMARFPYEAGIDSDLFLRFSPLMPVFYFIDNFHLPLFFWPAILILLLSVIMGRFFCGWICPLGTSLDVFDRLVGTPSNRMSGKWVKLRWLKYGLLAAFLVLAIFSIHLWGYFDPLAIFTRFMTVLIYPLVTLMVESLLIAGSQISFIETVSYPLFEWYKQYIMPEKQIFYQGIVITMVFLGAVFALEKLSKRFWCRYICPAGALLGVISQFRLYERIVGDSCPLCNRCQVECKMNAIPDGSVKETDKTECIECYNCGEKCPPNAKSIVFRFRWRPYRSAPDFSRRQFIGSSLAGILTLGLVSISLGDKTASHKIIRPPGSIPENEFLDRCIRCLQCVRICGSNGRCLQPGDFSASLVNLWTPVAVMREGYCEYNCNLCGLVCPTDAILPLPLEIKQKTPMGLAYFDKNLCIPFERHEDCIVCEEHCPTPNKAIKFDIKDVILSDGTQKKVKYPYVVRELCIGCGICEEKCPLPTLPGIFTTRDNEKRYDSLPV